MGRKRIVTLAVVVVMGIAGSALAPDQASADHLNFSHWGHGYRPWVSAPDSSLWRFTSEGEWGWSVNGYPNGFCTSTCAPNVPCDLQMHRGGIVVCKVPKSQLPQPSGCNNNCIGLTDYRLIYDPNAHLDSVYIRLCSDCGLTDYQFQANTNHEYGHALGQNHTATYPCVMQQGLITKYQCAHERDVMAWAYQPHD
jgi:hypothetical protein